MIITLKIKTDTITPDLRRRLRRVENPSPVLRGAAKVLVDMAKDAFSNTSNRPAAWAPLRPATLSRKAAKGYGSQPLIASGTLARSPFVISAGRTTAVIGSDRRAGAYSLAGIHQLGAPKRNIPPRPFFPFNASGEANEKAKGKVRAVIVRWLNILGK